MIPFVLLYIAFALFGNNLFCLNEFKGYIEYFGEELYSVKALLLP